MQYDFERIGETGTLKLRNDLSAHNIFTLRELLRMNIANVTTLVIDISLLDNISIECIKALEEFVTNNFLLGKTVLIKDGAYLGNNIKDEGRRK